MKATSIRDNKQRRLLVAIPLLSLPFILLLFWLLGGGKTSAQQAAPTVTGLSTVLPGPDLNEGNTDKLDVYRQAVLDSMKIKEQMASDPFYDSTPDSAGSPLVYSNSYSFGTGMPSGDANVDLVQNKLTDLYKMMDQQQAAAQQSSGHTPAGTNPFDETNTAVDPEMAQLDDMLDKIMDIQNPNLAKEKLRQQSMKNRKQAIPVVAAAPQATVTTLGRPQKATISARKKVKHTRANAFFDLSEQESNENSETNAVSAVIAQTATVTSGATIRLKLTADVYIAGALLKAGTLIHGICALSGDRLNIQFSSIRNGNALYPVNLLAYDMDGLDGIYMPGAMSRDVAKNSAQDAVQGIDYYSMDNSVTSQAAGVGIQAAKSLLTKKAKLIKVTVRAGYRLLLKDPNAQL